MTIEKRDFLERLYAISAIFFGIIALFLTVGVALYAAFGITWWVEPAGKDPLRDILLFLINTLGLIVAWLLTAAFTSEWFELKFDK